MVASASVLLPAGRGVLLSLTVKSGSVSRSGPSTEKSAPGCFTGRGIPPTPVFVLRFRITIAESWKILLASALLLPPVPVARVRETPPTLNVVVAWMSTAPAVVDVMLILHVPVPPLVTQSSRLLPVPPQLLPSSGPVNTAPAVLLSSVNTTHVPSGAGPKPVVA